MQTYASVSRREKNAMRENHTAMLFIIDRSGSMSPLTDDTIGGFNTVLEDNKQANGTADVTLVLFDHEFLRSIDHIDIQEVLPLDRSSYVPRGMTALLDAIGMSVSGEIARQAALAEDEKPEKTIITIITDGQENASKEWTYDKVRNLLSTVQDEKKWVVSFLGANIDAIKEASNIGIRANMAANYMADGAGVGAAYSSVSKMQRMVRGVSKATMRSASYDAVLDEIASDSFEEVRKDYASRSGKTSGNETNTTDSGRKRFGWFRKK